MKAMSKTNKWTPLETEMLQRMIEKHEGSPSGAYAEHPDWKAKLESKHSSGAIYAKIHSMKKGGAKKKQPVGNHPPAAGSRFVVVREEDLQRITCPNCQHSFNVLNLP